MADSLTDWDDEYARLSRAASQLRSNNNNFHREQHKQSIRTGLARLQANLETMQRMGEIDPQDCNRRKLLVDNLSRQVGGGHQESVDLLSGPNTTGKLSTTAQALRYQDEMINELAGGVSRLKDQTIMINEEARHHNKLLDSMDGDVEIAKTSLSRETARALKLKEDQGICRLYGIIACLSVLLFILISTGLN